MAFAAEELARYRPVETEEEQALQLKLLELQAEYHARAGEILNRLTILRMKRGMKKVIAPIAERLYPDEEIAP